MAQIKPLNKQQYFDRKDSVKDFVTRGNNLSNTRYGLMSSNIFGIEQHISKESRSYLYDRLRSRIELVKPVINPLLVTSNLNVISNILGLNKSNILIPLIDCTLVYNITKQDFMSTLSVDLDDEILINGEALRYFIKNFNKEKRIDEYIYKCVHEKFFSYKDVDYVKECICVVRGSGDVHITGKYYFNILNSSKLNKENLTDFIEQDLFLMHTSTLSILLNLKSESLDALVLDYVRVTPPGTRPTVMDRTNPVTLLYAEILKNNSNVNITDDYCSVNEKSRAYKKLYLSVSNLFVRIDPLKIKRKPIIELLGRKEGKFRGDTLGFRVDYSGRSVVIIEPTLKVNQCALPKDMFKEIMKYHTKFKPEPLTIEQALKIPVYLNRAPTLHLLGILGFEVVLWDKQAIGLNPLITTGFNADFDGDQMAVHVPLSVKAIDEVRNLMLADKNVYIPGTGVPCLVPRQELVYGIYILSRDSAISNLLFNKSLEYQVHYNKSIIEVESLDEAVLLFKLKKYKVSDTVTYKKGVTTLGNLVLRYCIPESLHEKYGLVNADSKEMLNNVENSILKKGVLKLKCKINYVSSTSTIEDYKPSSKILKDCIINADTTTFKEIVEKSLNKNLEDVSLDFNRKNIESIDVLGASINNYKLIKKSIGKESISNLTTDILSIGGDPDDYLKYLDRLVDCSFTAATLYPPNISILHDIKVIDGIDIANPFSIIENRLDDLRRRYNDGLENSTTYSRMYNELYDEMRTLIVEVIRKSVGESNGYTLLMDSGARGSMDNLIQIFSHKGRISRPDGSSFNVILKSSLSSQLTPIEHFVAAYGTRLGVVDKTLKPAQTGSLSRYMADTADEAVIRSDDCGTTKGILISRKLFDEYGLPNATTDLSIMSYIEDLLIGRYIAGTNEFITKEKAVKLAEDPNLKVIIRSPITCEDPYCSKCYGVDMTTRRHPIVGLPIGVIAGQSIGEIGTQMTMRTFQKGGVATNVGITDDFSRITRLFSLQSVNKKNPMYDPVAWCTGVITYEPTNDIDYKSVLIDGIINKLVIAKGIMLKEYVEEGDGLSRIQGDLDIPSIIKYGGYRKAQQYILYKLYLMYKNNANLNSKHIEVILAEMHNYLVLDSSTSNVKVGAIISPLRYAKYKNNLKVRDALFGTMTVTKMRDSFLSGMGFMHLKEIICRATLRGDIDDCESPMSRAMIGHAPLLGTNINSNYIQERLESFRSPTVI